MGNDDLCFLLINKILDQDGTIEKCFSSFNKNRASHILVTWLLGIKLANKFSLVKTDSSFNNQRFNQIWLMTSISHDYGYFKKELLEESFDLRTLKYNLLTDHYDIDFLSCLNYLEVKSNFENYFSYSYDEIKNYFEYSKQYQKDRKYSPNHEKCDHGIVGACMLFNEYCEKCHREILKGLNQSFVITQIRKIACIISASHNIFKSSSIEQDNIYKKYKLSKLLSTSAIRVRKENNILSLLSLVDTIECTKRFSAKENSGEFLHQKTVLKKIEINENLDSIEFNFKNLFSYLNVNRKSEQMVKKLNNHIMNVDDLCKWTEFKSKCTLEDYSCLIFLN